ncbi:MAG: transposase [Myxococcota bacterium]|jgi:transposase
MIGTSPAVRVFAYGAPADLRKRFDGLAGIVERHFQRDLHDGDLFLFIDRRKTAAKVDHWAGTGVCIYVWEDASTATTVSLTQSELGLLMEGANLRRSHPFLLRKHANEHVSWGSSGGITVC